MADIKFTPKARNANAIPNEPFSNGSLIAATDTGELYVDYNGARMRIGDVITLETEAQRIATLAPLPKLYWVAETGKLWRFADDWVCVNPDDIEADTLSLAKKRFFQVAEFSTTLTAYEVLIKTKVPKINGICMPLIRVYGYAGNTIIEFNVFVYWSTNKFSYVKATNTGMWQPNLKAFTYTENATEYIGIALQGSGGYYLHFVVDFLDMWINTRNYNEGWTIEANTNSTGTIIPPDNLTEIPWQALRTSITGNATTATTATTAGTISSTLPVTKGGTGATNASSARTALEAGYTIRRTITTTGAGWYRIAATTVNVGRNYTDVFINANLAGRNSQIGLIAAVTYGSLTTAPTAIQLTQKACVEQYKDGITKARIVYPNSSYANKYAYLEIYQAYDAAATYTIEFQNCSGWATRYDEPIAGEIPDGYSAREITFVHNAIVADKFVGDVVGTVDFAKNYVGRIDPDSPTAPDFFSTSLNDARTPGWYSVAGIPSNIDGPTEAGTNRVWGILQVGTSTGETIPEGSNGWVMQTLTLTTDEVYHRNVVNAGSWKEWLKSVDSNDVATSLTTSYTNKIPTVDAAKTYIDAQVAELDNNYLPLAGGTLTGTIDGPRAEFDKARVGRLFKNVVSGTYTDTNYELLIKTGIPKMNGFSMPVIHVYGYTYNSIIDFSVLLYWQNNKITYKFAKNNGTWNPTLKAFTYTAKDGTNYLGLAVIGYSYYLRLTVDLFEQWTSKRDYSTGWTIEKNTSSSTSIVPTDNLTDVPWQALTTDIMGTATNSEQLAGISADQYALKENYLPLTGGTLTGSLTAKSFRGIVNPPLNQGSSFLNEPNTSAAACIPELMVDRLQFFPPANCLLETSSDGTSWTTKTLSASQWNSLLCCNPSYLAGLTWNNGTQLRLTFTYNTYVALSMLYLYVATGSRLKVIIERYRNSTQDWVELASMGGIVGQPQHVSLWHDAILFTNTSNDSYSSQVRVTLIHEGNSTDTPRIDMLRWKGGYPTANPYIYDWDPSRNVMFPAEVRASNFNGQWSDKSIASSFDENSTSTIPTCKQIADYVKSLIGG